MVIRHQKQAIPELVRDDSVRRGNLLLINKEMPRQAGHDSAQGMTTCILFISFNYIIDNSVKAGFYGTHSA